MEAMSLSDASRSHALRTRITVDPRTNKLLVQTYSLGDLQDIEMLIGEIDVETEADASDEFRH